MGDVQADAAGRALTPTNEPDTVKEIGIAVWALVCFLISTYIGYTVYWPSVAWVLNTSDHQLLFYVAILPYTVGVLVWWIGAVLAGWVD